MVMFNSYVKLPEANVPLNQSIRSANGGIVDVGHQPRLAIELLVLGLVHPAKRGKEMNKGWL